MVIHKKEALRLRDDRWFRAFKLIKYRIKNRYQPIRKEWSFVPFYDKRCIFVHIPKAAGVSVANSLFHNLAGGHEDLKYYQSIFSEQNFKSYYKFAFVRNPWDRVHSAYEFLKKGGFGTNDQQWFNENLSQLEGFEDFVLNWLNEDRLGQYIHFRPQTDFLTDQEGQIRMDFIGKFENLKKDFDYIASQLGIRSTLRTANVNQDKSEYQKDFTEPMVKKIRLLYAQDIANFGYSYS